MLSNQGGRSALIGLVNFLSCFKFNFSPATKSRLLVISVRFGAGNEVFVTFVCVCMRVDIVAR